MNTPPQKPRARDIGLKFPGTPATLNAITDVKGVSVGYTTLIEGHGKLVVGKGPVRTGVTAILPRPVNDICQPVFAGMFSLNGNGEMTGSHYIEEVGKFALPVTITNTHSCGIARDATIRWAAKQFPDYFEGEFALPVAAETYDGFLNDINGMHITADHVEEAIVNATSGAVDEGSVGGGTGMKCFDFKAGSGTASRVIQYAGTDYTLGTFVQANFGDRADLKILGQPIGQFLAEPPILQNTRDSHLSSIIVIIATDAPLLPHQLKRLARRATFGIGNTGGFAHHGSGDIFLAFSTANTYATPGRTEEVLLSRHIPDEHMDPLFAAVVQSTEEAILNSLIANRDMNGRDGNFVPALPHEALKSAMGIY